MKVFTVLTFTFTWNMSYHTDIGKRMQPFINLKCVIKQID